MATIFVNKQGFQTFCPRKVVKGTVNAEHVTLVLDPEWDGLTVIIHWLNVVSGVEITPMLERDKPNTIPWEVLTDLGELRMGLIGMDGDTTVKPTIWLTYGYVVDGVDPDGGDDPQEPTQNYLAQMVEQATQANQAAQDAKDYAQQVAESIESAGPYAEEAKEAAEAAKMSEGAAQTAAQEAQRSQQAAQEAVASIGNAVEQALQAATDAGAAKSAAETAQGAAAQSAGTAQTAATTASQAAQTAQGAANQAGQYLTSVEADAQAAASAAAEAEKSQEAAQTAAQEAGNARDQANTAATTAQGHATAADTAKTVAEQAADNAVTAKTGAEQAAQAAAGSASAAQTAKEAAEAAASILPTPTKENAGKAPVVNPDGTGYIFGEAGGGIGVGHFVLVEEIEVFEPVSKITRTKFPDGTPYNLSSAFVEIKAKSESSTGIVSIIFHNSDAYGVIVADFAYITLKATTQVSIGHCRSLGSGCFEYERTTDSFSTEIRAAAMSGAKVNISGADAIKQIVLSKFTADIPAGSTIRIWGCQSEN